ncbi:glycine zipper 2TM domain-containing protein [Limnobacter sp.]|uniref:glycine zipper 2TM domain-containing protein n=1 Tax=Limnobacter sp. TaxID=2003368 RepID=UPI003510FCEA
MEIKRTNPLIIAAAVAIILTCGVAIATMTGLLPSSQANNADEVAALEADAKAGAKADESMTNKAATTTAAKPAAKPASKPAPVQTAAVCGNCGKVVDVRQTRIEGEGTGLGAVAGGVVGGLLGNQIGGGNGKKLATAAGVVGGAVVGNKIEKDRRATVQYDVVVQFDDGSTSTYPYKEQPYWQPGDRVKVVNGQLTSSL